MKPKFKLRIVPSVTREAARICSYRVKEQGQSAGDRFLKALDQCYDRIQSDPYAYSIRKEPYRYIMLHRLKYRLVYKVEGDLVSVVQIRHMSRRPSKRFGP